MAVITGLAVVVIIGIVVRLVSKKKEINEELFEPLLRKQDTAGTELARQEHFITKVAPSFMAYQDPGDDYELRPRAKTFNVSNRLRPINSEQVVIKN